MRLVTPATCRHTDAQPGTARADAPRRLRRSPRCAQRRLMDARLAGIEPAVRTEGFEPSLAWREPVTSAGVGDVRAAATNDESRRGGEPGGFACRTKPAKTRLNGALQAGGVQPVEQGRISKSARLHPAAGAPWLGSVPVRKRIHRRRALYAFLRPRQEKIVLIDASGRAITRRLRRSDSCRAFRSRCRAFV